MSFSEPGWLNDLGSWITYQLTNTEWVRKLQKRVHSTRSASDKVYQLLAHGRWFSPDIPASSTTKTGRHDIAEILPKVALNTKIHHQIILMIGPGWLNELGSCRARVVQ